tara:strand:+ start:143 stop:751 length:609 start_codon:yes stop_codon:yes gene_type:complete
LGGLYLAFEGVEKIYEFFFPHARHEEAPPQEMTEEEILSHEKEKIKSAILTDFILSIEIVIIALGSVAQESLTTQVIVVSLIALVATIGVYGIVALIVRMDEFGLKLINLNEEDDSFSDKVGKFLVAALPRVIKGLSIIGTVALLTVSGGIFVHNLHFFHALEESIHMPAIIFELLVGLIVGIVVLAVVMLASKIYRKVFKR